MDITNVKSEIGMFNFPIQSLIHRVLGRWLAKPVTVVIAIALCTF